MISAHTPEDDLPPIALEIACQNSTADWQMHLEQLFHNARDRFPDVVWELQTEKDALPSEEVWGHKAMVYARAPPTFQARYFSFRPAPVASPSPYGPSPMPAQSAVSLGLSLTIEAPSPARSPSPNTPRAMSPTPSAPPGQILRLTTTIASALFSQELEYLYTGKSFGDAFEFLFDSPEKRDEGDGEKNRVDKLRKDLVFMWRSRLYSDVRIQLEGNFSSSTSTQDDPTVTPVFSSHRFILVSRSPYFRNLLLGKSFALPTPPPGQPLILHLPSPPFTPASLHFTLGFIYTGTLAFSHRTFDLDTAFHIMRSASYLSIMSLYDEIEARIIEDMCHGLFMAYTSFAEYEAEIGGKWGLKGCKCRQCARRAPRILEFATSGDVQNDRLANGARRALVGLFGDGWCTPEFAALPVKTRESLLKGVDKRTIPLNVFPLLFAAHRALVRLREGRDKDRDLGDVKDLVEQARKRVGQVLCEQAEACFEQSEWISLMEADGGRFEDGEKVEWVMDAVRGGLSEKKAPFVYQILVSSILLRPHPEDPNQTMLSHTSGIRQQVEATRLDVAKWIHNHWMNVHAQGGFEELDGWALKELSHEMEVPLEDLIRPSPLSNRLLSVPKSVKAQKPEGDGDTASMTSVRTGVVNPLENADDDAASTSNASLAPPQSAPRMSVVSSASSVRSGISMRSTNTRAKGPPTTPRRPSNLTTAQPGSSARPSSRASATATAPRTPSLVPPRSPRTPSMASQRERTPSMASQTSTASRSPSQASRVKPPASTTSVRKSVTSRVSPDRPKSLAPSVASTVRKTSPSSSSRPTSTLSVRTGARVALKKDEPRPVSSASTKSEASSTFQTAKSDIPDSRRSSVASTTSNTTAGRKRTISNASLAAPSTSTKKLPPVPKRPPSTMSTHSNISTVSMTNRKAVGKAAAAKAAEKRDSVGKLTLPPVTRTSIAPKITTTRPTKEKGKTKADVQETVSTPTSSTTSDGSTLRAGTVRSALKKSSSDTLTGSIATSTTTSTITATPATPRASKALSETPAQGTFIFGATLNVGIPCIISSKRSRFRAYARYIGELEGEIGPWVGVEVPVGEAWGPEKLDGRAWNDGSWAGRRYFEIGSNLEWDENEERRKRRKEGSGGMTRERTLKREGEQLGVDRPKRIRSTSPAVSDASTSESRGLFVRPKDVIYVLDAVSEL